jgi:Flp pilus assembly pilin Flp
MSQDEKGQALIEYALCCAVLVVALLVPWGGDDPVVVQLARALRGYFRGISFLLSIS